MVHGRGFCGTERGEGHGWYTGGASEVRNGEKEAVGTPQCILVYEMCGMKDLYTRRSHTEANADETGVRRKRRRKKRWKGRRWKGRKGLRDQYCRGPKMEVPMRTMVAPWRMARGQSWDIPMESSVKSVSWG